MGLQKDIILANGLEAKDAYLRVDTISGSKNGLDMSINYYVSRQAFKDGKSYLEQKIYNFVPSVAKSSDNFIKQGYLYLKTLEEFKASKDILED